MRGSPLHTEPEWLPQKRHAPFVPCKVVLTVNHHAFGQADLEVSVVLAGWAHLLWCPRSGKVVERKPDEGNKDSAFVLASDELNSTCVLEKNRLEDMNHEPHQTFGF